MRSSGASFKSFAARPVTHRSPSYYFRRIIPRDLCATFGGRREIRVSLRTSDKDIAYRRWLVTSFRWLELVNLARELIDMGKIPHIHGMPHGLADFLNDGGTINKYTLKVDPVNPEKITVELDRSELAQVASHLALLSGQPKSVDANAPMTHAVAPPTRSMRLFSEVVEDYIEDDREGSWTEKSKQEFQATLRLITDALGDPPFVSINKDVLRAARRKLRMVPPRRSLDPRYRELSFDELILYQEKRKARGESIDVVHLNTFNKWWDTLIAMYEWAITATDLVDRNYAKKLKFKEKSEEKDEDEGRRAYTDDELRMIFESEFFKPGGYASPHQYWTPVLCYYEGPRTAEIAQAPLDAVKRDPISGTVYIDVSRRNGFRIKTGASRREIPIHPQIADSFWAYCQRLISEGFTRVFPDINHEQKHGPGRSLSRFVNDQLLERLGLTDPDLVGHSFRHNFAQALERAGVEDKWTRRLMGHAGKTSLADYAGRPGHDVLLEHLVRARFPVTPPPFEWVPILRAKSAR